MRGLVRRLHLWTGLALSLLLLTLAVTGGALVYKEAYWRLVYPELRSPVPALAPADHAAAIAAAERLFGDELSSVKLPEPGVSAYHLYLADGEAFLSATDHRVIDRWGRWDRLPSLLFDLHAHLMAGEGGERVGGVAALLGVFLALTGLVLWWPTRRRLTLRNLAPRELSRRSVLLWHRDLGALASPLLLLLLLTGSGLVFHDTARALLNGIFGDPVPGTATPRGAGAPVSPPDGALLARVEAIFPGSRVVFYYPPRELDGIHRFRLAQPCELHPNGRSYVSFDAAGRVVERVDACSLPPGERGAQALYPLHAGKGVGAAYKLAAFLGALALAGLSLSGAAAYLKRLRRG